MRFLLIALMIALLPLRGWAGHVMAVEMAGQQVAAAHAVAQQSGQQDVELMDARMPADCLMADRAEADRADRSSGTPATAGASCNNCDTCELCLALATSSPHEWPSGAIALQAAPLPVGTDFSSADRVSSLKPPIS